jgi:hypothetical protein
MDSRDCRIAIFKAKYGGRLFELVTQGSCVASCIYEGDAELAEAELDWFVGMILDVLDAETSEPRPRRVVPGTRDNVVPMTRST